MTTLQVDSGDPTPAFEQIRRQLAQLIDSGHLEAGQRLPTVRQLAADLRVAPGTVVRAFKELEAGGYIETRRAAGTRVRSSPRPDGQRALERLADQYVQAAARSGATDAQIVRALQDAVARKATRRPSGGGAQAH